MRHSGRVKATKANGSFALLSTPRRRSSPPPSLACTLRPEACMDTVAGDDYKSLKLALSGYLKPGEQLCRNVLFDQLYGSIPKDSQVKVQIYNAEIAPN